MDEEQMDVLRQLAYIRQLRAHLEPFAASPIAQVKLTPTDQRVLFDLLHEIDLLLPGCPSDSVLFTRFA
jgi:hypothetical protein